MARTDGKASFECGYSDAGSLIGLKILGLNENLKKAIIWKHADEEGQDSVSGPSQEASDVVDRQIGEQGKRAKWTLALDTPMKTKGVLETTMAMNRFVLFFDTCQAPMVLVEKWCCGGRRKRCQTCQ